MYEVWIGMQDGVIQGVWKTYGIAEASCLQAGYKSEDFGIFRKTVGGYDGEDIREVELTITSHTILTEVGQ